MLKINATDLASILDHCRKDYPREACGIMKGRKSIDTGKHVSEVVKIYRTKNIHSNPLKGYKMHAEDQYKIYVELDPELELIGFYHSHPHGPYGPSKTDIDECNYHGYSFLIVSFENLANPEVSAWILYEDRAEEELMDILG